MNDSPSAALCHVLTVIDGDTEGLVDVIEIKNFEIISFRKQFDVCPESDPEMRNRYGIGPDDAHFVNNALGRIIAFDFTHYAYFIEAAEKH